MKELKRRRSWNVFKNVKMFNGSIFDLNAKEVRKLNPKSTQPIVDMSAEAK